MSVRHSFYDLNDKGNANRRNPVPFSVLPRSADRGLGAAETDGGCPTFNPDNLALCPREITSATTHGLCRLTYPSDTLFQDLIRLLPFIVFLTFFFLASHTFWYLPSTVYQACSIFITGCLSIYPLFRLPFLPLLFSRYF